ncbi:MAG: hypothetical protein HUJ56_12705 [Erysipelotrichaceae bacterium]|nr:hypothetical protein [Erysipelotrichaceae bacterium]
MIKKLVVAFLCMGLLVGCTKEEESEPVEEEVVVEEAIEETSEEVVEEEVEEVVEEEEDTAYCWGEGKAKEFLDGYGKVLERVYENVNQNMPYFDEVDIDKYNEWNKKFYLEPQLNYVQEYVGEDVRDTTLAENIEKLSTALQVMVDHNNDYGNDNESHYEYYLKQGLYERADVLKYFSESYGFKLHRYDVYLNEDILARDYDIAEQQITEIFAKVTTNEEENWFGVNETTDGITIENTTDYSYKNISVYMVVTFYEGEEYRYIDSQTVELWEQGEEVTFEFDYGEESLGEDVKILVYDIYPNLDYTIDYKG